MNDNTNEEATSRERLQWVADHPGDSVYVPDRGHDAFYARVWCYGLICVKCNEAHEAAPSPYGARCSECFEETSR